MCEARSDYHPASAAAGWSLLLDTFERQLGPDR